jgi:asparagine synthase (glutamine-hydrolysing)
MCGINGVFGAESKQQAEKLVAVMNASLVHRGPDDGGSFVDDFVGLGHRRLAIIDLSSAGHQPLLSSDGRYCIVYNGELYNFRQLRFELQRIVQGSGHQAYAFATNSDTEVILAAYMRWGSDCIKYFNGMFAFAIWDKEKKELFIARDRLGIKPLYYYTRKELFLFASEIRALLSTNLIPRKVDKAALCDYLRYQTVHAPRTIIQGIGMLMPGHTVQISAGKIEVSQYWNMQDYINKKPQQRSYKEICSDVNELLLRSVERRLVSDVPFGAFLSGGIDSSIIVGMMSKVAGTRVKTFSVSFDESEFSEARYSQLIADKFGTEHHPIHLKASDFLEQLPEALHAMDHPSGDGPNTYVVSKATRNAGITMALSGLGGDELFAGYDIFKRSLLLNKYNGVSKLPYFVRTTAGYFLQKVKPGTASDKISEILRQEQWSLASTYPVSRQVMTDAEISRIMPGIAAVPNAVQEFVGLFPSIPPAKLISAVSVAESGSYMVNTLLRDTDQMSMAVALEVRVPFLDHTLVEYVLGLSDNSKFPVTPKKLLVDSVGDLLPPELINRPKMGFTLPWKHWLKNELRLFCTEKLESLGCRNMFSKEELLRLWKAFLSDDPRVSWSRIWYLVVLESWLKENEVDV